ncbi:uncharacterized protein [Venturia canescens]|uniref:uncharacterized protein n=1 Tax=Venturia canescens TaxID=32260 RepID=UPI001C9C52C9|nr:uncharacterized protein LOC122415269 [Venturia canescens]
MRLQFIGVMSFCVMNIMKYGALRNERPGIGRCTDDLVADWARLIDTEERTIMYSYATLGRHGTTLCTCFSYAGSFFYIGIVPLLVGKIVIPDTNVTIRPLPLPGYFVFFDPQSSPAYEIVYALHCYCSFVMHTTAAASCSLAIIFVMHACGQLEIVNLWLKRFIDGDDEYFLGCKLDSNLGDIIKQHVRTLSFISRTEEILREICLVDLLGSTLNLCLLGFDILTQWEDSGPVALFTYSVLIVSFLINIFSFCYIGEILTEKCRKVGEKTYMIDWYKLPRKTALGLALTIATADRPITITAGKLTNLSLTTFFNVVKTSIGYLNMLRTAGVERNRRGKGSDFLVLGILVAKIVAGAIMLLGAESVRSNDDEPPPVSSKRGGNALFEKDFEYATRMNRFFLRPIGMWPSRSDKLAICTDIFVRLQICCCYFLICFLLIPCGLHTFLVEKDAALQLKMIGPLSFCLMAITKFTFLVYHRNDIYNCLKHIALDWANVGSSGERQMMLADAKGGRFVATLCAGFMYGGGFFYHTIMPLSCGVITMPDNTSLRPMTYPVYEPFFDAQASPIYEIVFITQWCSGFVVYTITIGACSIAAVFVNHACGQFKILINRLNNLVDGDDKKCNSSSVDERMADIVELHIRTLNFVKHVEAVLNEVCLVEFVGCTMNICFLGYYFITEWERSEAISTVTYCVLLVSFTFNIFIFCYIGEKLSEQSKLVGTMTYAIEWYRLQHTKARRLILILIISKYPARITAGKMAELSLNCFSNVLKTALTYLNLLRTVAN